MKRHLEPLALAANITQATFCCMDQVLLTFGFLVLQYQKMANSDVEDQAGCTAIIASLERRWLKADQELFIGAVLLNPFFRTSPFAPHPALNIAGVYTIIGLLWTRFYDTAPPDVLNLHIGEYLAGSGFFKHLDWQRKIHQMNADRVVRPPLLTPLFLLIWVLPALPWSTHTW